LMISEVGSQSTLARLEKPATCIRRSQYWCSTSMHDSLPAANTTDWRSYPLTDFLLNF